MKYFKLTEMEVEYIKMLLFLDMDKQRDIHQKNFIKSIIKELEASQTN